MLKKHCYQHNRLKVTDEKQLVRFVTRRISIKLSTMWYKPFITKAKSIQVIKSGVCLSIITNTIANKLPMEYLLVPVINHISSKLSGLGNLGYCYQHNSLKVINHIAIKLSGGMLKKALLPARLTKSNQWQTSTTNCYQTRMHKVINHAMHKIYYRCCTIQVTNGVVYLG